VPQAATDRDIKKAYRQKALKLHPDVNKAVSDLKMSTRA
jgi:curved DNA-binding protein CbpA